jgi:hypothetical protein
MPHNIAAYFESYANLYNRALAGEDVFAEIMSRFAKSFVAAGPDGVTVGKQGPAFRRMLGKGYRFYRQIGTRKMTARRVEATPIDATHCQAKVTYRADYQKPDGETLSLDFDITYMLDVSHAKPLIFAFVAGDEMAMYRKAGLIVEDKPVEKPKRFFRPPVEKQPPERRPLH